MKWKLKAAVQKLVAGLPASWSYPLYYWLQRHCGTLRHVVPVGPMQAGREVCRRIEQAGRRPAGGIFLEIGTGRRLNMPLVYWLAGAAEIVTVDLNPYLKEELVREDLAYVAQHRAEIETLLEGHLESGRLEALLQFAARRWRLADLLAFCRIHYIAPADAALLPLPPRCIDFYTSYNVLEHIPPEALRAILTEGNRVLKRDGLFVHRIDHSDHFAHSDRSISTVHFLRFDATQWAKIAGNRYMYMNRLRADDYESLFQALQQQIVLDDPVVDAAALGLLRGGQVPLDSSFRDKDEAVLATVSSWVVTEKRRAA